MKTLELKHLAPYLPYELLMQHVEWKRYGRGKIIGKLVGIVPDKLLIKNSNYTESITEHSYNTYKPLLRPLSDLTKEIEYNGEKFVPIENLSIHLFPLLIKEDILTGEINGIPYWVMEKLFEWHFDVFGLIPKGLAIDKSTIK